MVAEVGVCGFVVEGSMVRDGVGCVVGVWEAGWVNVSDGVADVQSFTPPTKLVVGTEHPYGPLPRITHILPSTKLSQVMTSGLMAVAPGKPINNPPLFPILLFSNTICPPPAISDPTSIIFI